MQVDAQNRFTGKSFEIRPTGVANVDILLPVEWEPTYPKLKKERLGSEHAVEHYSWKKVTTNVSGFILGSPTIDHYGDMIVRSLGILGCPTVNLNSARSRITGQMINAS
jgi:oxysterol-binding protein 1